MANLPFSLTKTAKVVLVGLVVLAGASIAYWTSRGDQESLPTSTDSGQGPEDSPTDSEAVDSPAPIDELDLPTSSNPQELIDQINEIKALAYNGNDPSLLHYAYDNDEIIQDVTSNISELRAASGGVEYSVKFLSSVIAIQGEDGPSPTLTVEHVQITTLQDVSQPYQWVYYWVDETTIGNKTVVPPNGEATDVQVIAHNESIQPAGSALELIGEAHLIDVDADFAEAKAAYLEEST